MTEACEDKPEIAGYKLNATGKNGFRRLF